MDQSCGKDFFEDEMSRNYNQMMETLNRKLQDMTEQMSQLRQENERLRSKKESVPYNAINDKSDSNENSEELQNLNAMKNSLDLLFEERLQMRRQLMACESDLKKIDLRLLFRKYDTERHKLMALDDHDMTALINGDPLQALYNQN